MNVKTNFIKIIFIAIVIVQLAGCYNKEKSEGNVFHYNEFNGISSLDPAFAKSQSTMWAAHQFYNTLVEVDDQLNIKPALAQRWDISEDRKIFIFHRLALI